MRNLRRPLALTTLLLSACSANHPAPAGSTASTQSPSPQSPHHTFLLVHGAWGGGWAFRQVDDLLTADGNKVFRPTLTGQGERAHLSSPNINLSTHIQDIVNVIEYENLHHLILVGHSYGGMVITGVADRLPDRIDRLVYVDAALPQSGESLNTAFDHASGTPPGRRRTTPGRIENGFSIPAWVNPNTPPPHDVPMSLKCFNEPLILHHETALRAIPTTYILTVDKGHPPESDTFYPFYRRAKARGFQTWTMEGDHNVQWSHPHELVALLEKAANE